MSSLSPRERELIIDALNNRHADLIRQSIETRRRMKSYTNGLTVSAIKTYADDTAALAVEVSILRDRLAKEALG